LRRQGISEAIREAAGGKDLPRGRVLIFRGFRRGRTLVSPLLVRWGQTPVPDRAWRADTEREDNPQVRPARARRAPRLRPVGAHVAPAAELHRQAVRKSRRKRAPLGGDRPVLRSFG